jgi:hypothetical protein
MTGRDSPVIALSRIVLGTLPLLERLVETEIMPNAVLPAVLVDAVELEGVRDPLVDRSKSKSAIGCTKDGHANQLGVAVRGFGAVIVHDWHLKMIRKALEDI